MSVCRSVGTVELSTDKNALQMLLTIKLLLSMCFYSIYRDVHSKPLSTTLEAAVETCGGTSAVCPWDSPPSSKALVPVETKATISEKEPPSSVSVSICPWDDADAKLPPER